MIQFIKVIGLASILNRRYKKQTRNPIVFVPGLYGSMGDEIIPGTGKWGFGMAASVYEPLIKKLQDMGYVLGESLFIAHYDWRKECKYCMKKYLKPVVGLAKKKSKSQKVDIICHSMGGLVSRAYVQDKSYDYDVSKIIFIATPHAGAANTYSFWTEGKLLSKKDAESQLFTTLLEGYLWILTKLHNYKNEMETIHNLLLGALDLMPNKDYGEYLYYFDEQKNIRFIPYESFNYRNDFLDELNKNKSLLKTRKIDTTLIVGKGVETNEKFQTSKSQKSNMERIVSVLKTNEGDGTVTLNSATAIEGDTYIFHAGHTEILKRCIFVIENKLGIADGNVSESKEIVDSKTSLEDKHVSILIKGKGKVKIYLKTHEMTKLLYDGNIKEKDVYIEEYGDMLKWVVIRNMNENQLFLDYEPEENDSMDIQVKSSSGKKIKFRETQPIRGNPYRIKI